ncbi:hypothetical protein D3C72_2421180 [compost metagenome]
MFAIPQAGTVEQEVANRRRLAREVVAILNESDSLKGAERAKFVRGRFEALEQSFRA